MNILRSLLIVFASATSSMTHGTPLPSAPVVALDQALAGNVRLLVWELPNGAGIEVQALNATTHEALSQRRALGALSATGGEPRVGTLQMSPAVAALLDDNGNAVFLVAWHAEVLGADGNPRGTEIVGQRVTVEATTGVLGLDPLLRVSRADDDSNGSAGSETRSPPSVAANVVEQEFLVTWAHWPAGRNVFGDPPQSADPLQILGQEISRDGALTGSASIVLDDQQAPPGADGKPARVAFEPVFPAVTARPARDGYLLAWSDPAQEAVDADLAQLYSKLLPRDLATTSPSKRTPLGDSASVSEGTGRIALAPLPTDGYLLAYEDVRGTLPLGGRLLDANGAAVSERIILLDAADSGEGVFVSPRLVSLPQRQRLVLYAAVGSDSIAGSDAALADAHLVRRVLDPDALAFVRAGTDFETITDAYPAVNIRLAALAHAAGPLPDGEGDVSFAAVPNAGEITIVTRMLDAPDEPSGEEEGGGALFAILAALPWLRRRRGEQRVNAD